MNRIFIILLALTVSGFFFATPGLSMQPMPKESGTRIAPEIR